MVILIVVLCVALIVVLALAIRRRRRNVFARSIYERVKAGVTVFANGVPQFRDPPVTKVIESFCRPERSVHFTAGTRHSYLSAQSPDGRWVMAHAYYRSGAQQPYHLVLGLVSYEGEVIKSVRWRALEGRDLGGEECRTLRILDHLARSQGHPGLKPLTR